MRRFVRGVALSLAAFFALGVHAGQVQWAPEDFVVLSGPSSPRVAFAVQRTAAGLQLAVSVASLSGDGKDTSVTLGLSAEKKLILTNKDAQVSQSDGGVQYEFNVPAAALVSKDADWERLCLGLAVAWSGGALGQDRQRERFRHADCGAPHAGLSPSELDWQPLDLVAHEAMVRDLKNRIWVEFDQPMAGKATVVIEDDAGRRLRNLVAGVPFSAGKQRIEWDGLDESGKIVAPATYRWRAISHPGVVPEYLFSFCNDGNPGWRTGSGADMWGPDHTVFTAAAAGKEWTFFGGSCAESGYAIVAVDAQGVKRMHYNPVHGAGIEKVALAADGDFLYAAHDGFAWGQHVDRNKSDWKGTQQMTLTRFDVPSGRVVDFPGGKKFVVAATLEVGPGSANKDFKGHNLGGLAASGGKLYVSGRAANTILVFEAQSGKQSGEIKLTAPGALVFSGASLLAVSGAAIVKVDPVAGTSQPLVPAGKLVPTGIAADASGNVYVADAQTHQIHVADAAGKPVRVLGKAGGAYAGPYDAERLVNPGALAVAANGWLWVTEDRWTPKRLTAWDLKTGSVVKEKFGPTSYGASGAGFDAADHTRWIGQGALWKLDFERKSASCQAVLGGMFGGATNTAFLLQDGRTFLVSLGGATNVSELKADGSIRNLALIASTHRYCFGCDWKPPQVFVEAFNRAYPKLKGKHGDKGPGFLWVDKNGDGAMQEDEFDFSTSAENFAGAYWGHAQRDLTLRVLATVKGKRVLVALKPDGCYPGGAPKYPPLNDACRSAPPVDVYGNELETAVDRFGNVVCNSDPQMKCFAPDGRALWTYPNRWSNVHGSHAAPLPERGVMQGALFFLGMAPLDDKADVFVMNGNHGRFFVLSSDGFYLDEMFKDVRMGASLDAYLIGGECFGGFFGKSQKDGNYYLQSGHTDYRIFRLHGLDKIKRGEGAVAVSAAQAVAADNRQKRRAAEERVVREATVSFRAKPPKIDGQDNDWGGEPSVRWEKSGQFPVRVRVGYDDTNLYLHYTVADASPWVNNGKDWTTLFKTGDSVDLQIGSDPKADPKRSGPAPGDLRLLIAPFEGKEIAVLYRHRLAGAKDPVTFTCPWRSEKVDSVKKLETATIAVVREGGQYKVEAAVPLAELGLTAPAGKTFKADFGVIYGDPDGTVNMLRSYWANQATGLVNDVPGEIMLNPNLWGNVRFGDR